MWGVSPLSSAVQYLVSIKGTCGVDQGPEKTRRRRTGNRLLFGKLFYSIENLKRHRSNLESTQLAYCLTGRNWVSRLPRSARPLQLGVLWNIYIYFTPKPFREIILTSSKVYQHKTIVLYIQKLATDNNRHIITKKKNYFS